MATPRTYLWADALNNRLLGGWRGLVGAKTPQFRRGDLVPIVIRWVEVPMVSGGDMSEVLLPAGDTYAVYVGRRAEKPFGGQYYITYDGEDTEMIPYDAPPEVIERALNRVPAVSNTGGVSITQLNKDICKITFLQKGSRLAFTANGKSLFPSSDGVFSVIQQGDANNYHVVAFKLRQLPVGQCLSFTQEPACVAEVEQVKADIWEVYLTSDAKDGYFTMAIDDGEPIQISVFEDYSTFTQKLGANYNVIRAGDFRWRIERIDGTGFEAAIVSSEEIVSFSGVQGVLEMTDGEADEFMSGKAYAGAHLEIIRNNEDGSQMVVQVPCVVLNRIYT